MAKRQEETPAWVKRFVGEMTKSGAAHRGKVRDEITRKDTWNPLVELSGNGAKKLASASGVPWQACALPRRWDEVTGGDYQSLQEAIDCKVRELAARKEWAGKPVGLEVFGELWKDLTGPAKKKSPEEKLRAAVEAYARTVSEGAGCAEPGELAKCIERLEEIRGAADPMPGTPTTAPEVTIQ